LIYPEEKLTDDELKDILIKLNIFFYKFRKKDFYDQSAIFPKEGSIFKYNN
jgi:hypothetical protein